MTIALASIGSFRWARVPGYIAAQMLGGFLGARHRVARVSAALGGHAGSRRASWRCSPPAPAIRQPGANLITEIIGDVRARARRARRDLARTTSCPARTSTKGFGPLLVGVIVWSIGLSLGGPTGYAINPARDLGPRIAHAVLPIAGKGGSDWGYAWIPIVGPIIGGVLGALVYQLRCGTS